MPPIVIARFPRFKWLVTLTAGALFLGFAWWSIQTPRASWPHGPDLWAFAKWQGMVAIVFFYAVIMWCVYELASSRGVYAWISDGKLHLGRRAESLDSILDVSIGIASESVESQEGEANPEKAILVKLRDGREMTIDISLLSEPAEVVLARLRDALGLPKTV